MVTEVAARIRAHRVAAGLTQAEMGAKIGLPRERVCTIESGRYVATVKTLERVAKGLGITVSQLLEEPKPARKRRRQ